MQISFVQGIQKLVQGIQKKEFQIEDKKFESIENIYQAMLLQFGRRQTELETERAIRGQTSGEGSVQQTSPAKESEQQNNNRISGLPTLKFAKTGPATSH